MPVSFDVDRDIPKKNQDELLHLVDEWRESKNYIKFPQVYLQASILFGDKLPKLHEWEVDKIIEELDSSAQSLDRASAQSKKWLDYPELALAIKILFPQRLSEIPNFDKTVVIDACNWKRKNQRILTLAKSAVAAKILFDEETLTQKEINELKNFEGDDPMPNWVARTRALVSLKMLRINDYRLETNEWHHVRTVLSGKSYTLKPLDYLVLASNMRILAAGDVVIDENGIHLTAATSPAKELQAIPEIPQKRNF